MDFAGVNDVWLSAYVDEYIRKFFFVDDKTSAETLTKIKEFLRTETPSRGLIDEVVEFGDLDLIKAFEGYLTKDILNEIVASSLDWITFDPVWFFNLLLRKGGNTTEYINMLYMLYENDSSRSKNDLLAKLEVNEENAAAVADAYNQGVRGFLADDAKPFYFAYPEFFDLDVFAKNLVNVMDDDEVLEFATTIDGIFEKEMDFRVYLILAEMILESNVSEQVLNVISERLLRDVMKHQLLSDQVYYLLADIEFRTTYDPSVYLAFLMKARNYKDAKRLRTRFFQDKFMRKKLTAEIGNDEKLDDSFDSLVYLLDIILMQKNC